MKTEIYYFSGTGNSLYIAKDIAAKTDGTDGTLIPIASLMDKPTITPSADVIGIVFPVYYVDLPVIVKRFAERLENISSKYIFAVSNYGGGMGESFQSLRRIIQSRGGELAACFGIHMPQNAFHKPFENHQQIFTHWKKQLHKISNRINLRKKGMSISNWLLFLSLSPLRLLVKPMCKKSFIKLSGASPDLPVDELIHLTDKSFHTNNQCIGCGICAQVCPVGNIEMKDKRPVWLNRCETCLACYNYCPHQAIEGSVAQKGYFYRHPEVKVSEIINQKKTGNS